MPFFQNVFDQEFRGNLPIEDRQYAMTFAVPANRNSSEHILAGNGGPYDLSSDNTLTINYAFDTNFKAYSALAINVAGATAASTTAYEVATALNANATFAEMLVAGVYGNSAAPDASPKVLITKKPDRKKIHVRVYISNSSAEKKIRFNKNAGVAELPSYFARHTIANRYTYPDSQGVLIQLNTGDAVDQAIITEAGLDYSVVQTDWQLFRGRSQEFIFEKRTYSGSNLTVVIRYPAGARAGDLAKKIQYVYSGSNVIEYTEIPYTLQAADLVTPP